MHRLYSKPWFRIPVAVFCTLLWGTAYPMIKLGYREMNIETIPDKLMFASIRYLIAGLMVMVFVLFTKKNKLKLEKSRVGLVVIYGLVQTGLMYLFNYIGVANTTATKTSVLTALTAFLAVIVAPVFFKDEKITFLKILGCILGLGGILIVNLNFFSGSFTFFGEGFIIIAMLLNTAAGFIGKVAGKGNPFTVSSYQLLIGGAFLGIIALIFGGNVYLSKSSIFITVFLAFVSAAAFSLWTLLLVYNDASKILVFNLLSPPFGALFSFIILGERDIFSPLYIVSIILVCAGILLVNLDFGKRVQKIDDSKIDRN